MNTAVMFSTGKDNWETPHDLFSELDSIHHFTLDAAADERNHKCPWWFGPGSAQPDALAIDWSTDQVIWLNPPYSGGLQRKFIDRAVECAQAGGKVIALLPARTDTRLFHEKIWQTTANRPHPWVREVRFLKGRVKFVNPEAPFRRGITINSAPFPSMIVWFEQ